MALVISSLRPPPYLDITLSHNNIHGHRTRRSRKVRALSNKGGRVKLPEPEYGDVPSILSIDGGGVRGIIPTRILDTLESKLQEKDNCREARIADYFDMVAGTSTGGLIATLLTAPDQQNGNRPLKSAAQLTDFYLEECPQIFPSKEKPPSSRVAKSQFNGYSATEMITLLEAQKILGSLTTRSNVTTRSSVTTFSWLSGVESLLPLFKLLSKKLLGEGPEFPGHYLHGLVEDMLKELTLKDTLTNVLLTAYDMHVQQPTIFCTLRGVKNPVLNHKLSDACIATSAAPTYLPPHFFCGSEKEQEFHLTDGGVGANNPMLLALFELINHYPLMCPCFKNENVEFPVRVLSLGTGNFSAKYTVGEVKKWNKLDWVYSMDTQDTPIVNAMMEANNDIVDIQADSMFKMLNSKENYLRIQSYDLPKENMSPVNSNPDNLHALVKIGDDLLSKIKRELNLFTGRPAEIDPSQNYMTNEQALDIFAEKLVEERNKRLSLKQSCDQT